MRGCLFSVVLKQAVGGEHSRGCIYGTILDSIPDSGRKQVWGADDLNAGTSYHNLRNPERSRAAVAVEYSRFSRIRGAGVILRVGMYALSPTPGGPGLDALGGSVAVLQGLRNKGRWPPAGSTLTDNDGVVSV